MVDLAEFIMMPWCNAMVVETCVPILGTMLELLKSSSLKEQDSIKMNI